MRTITALLMIIFFWSTAYGNGLVAKNAAKSNDRSKIISAISKIEGLIVDNEIFMDSLGPEDDLLADLEAENAQLIQQKNALLRNLPK